jgi:hypothetical protein
LRDIGNVREPELQVDHRAVREFRRNHSVVTGMGFEQTLDRLLQLDVNQPCRRHDDHLAILEFVSLRSFGALRQPEKFRPSHQ